MVIDFVCILVFIFLVMSLLWDSGMTKIIFNSDSIDSLGLIEEDSTSFHKFGAIIAWIKGLLSRS